MIEPISMGLVGALLYRSVAHEGLLGEVFKSCFADGTLDLKDKVVRSIRDTLTAGVLPANHDLRKAALDSLRKAGAVLADAIACELDPQFKASASIGQRIQHRLFAAGRLTHGSTPEMAWVQNLIGALHDDKKLAFFGDGVLQVGADSIRTCE